LKFDIKAKDGLARTGILKTPHGNVHLPAITINATFGRVAGGLPAGELKKLGVEILMANAFHLHRNPGEEEIVRRGGIHWLTGFLSPIITDSGGFQMVSLASKAKVMEKGVEFNLDGQRELLTPEKVVDIQVKMGTDIAMVLDDVVPTLTPEKEKVREATERTSRWLARSVKQWKSTLNSTALFGIIQGGLHKDLRELSAKGVNRFNLPGIAIGGLAGGEEREVMYKMVEFTNSLLPVEKPKHLLGVGEPRDILETVERGMDLFDCVQVTRVARHGRLWTKDGYLRLNQSKYQADRQIVEKGCDCPACSAGVSRATLRAMLKSENREESAEARKLLMAHNIRFLMRFMADIRQAIEEHRFSGFKKEFLRTFKDS